MRAEAHPHPLQAQAPGAERQAGSRRARGSLTIQVNEADTALHHQRHGLA